MSTEKTRNIAIAEGPGDMQFHLKSRQLLHNFTKNRIWKGFQSLKVIESGAFWCYIILS